VRPASHDAGVTAAAEAVRALVVAYAERLDAGDFDGVASLFEHAVVRAARTGTELVGRDAVRGLYDPVIRYDDGTPRTKHVLANLDVRVDEDAGTATSHCVFTVWQATPTEGLRPVLTGRYDDAFTRVGTAWRFTERVIHADLLGDLSSHMRSR
jgi:ketosteroid isomerase-like protein